MTEQLLGDAQAAQLLLSCSGTAFAASTGLTLRCAQETFPSGTTEEYKPSHASLSKQLLFQIPATDSREHVGMLAAATTTTSPTSGSGGKKSAARFSSHSTASKCTFRTPSAQQDLHPVLKLGYETMCEVHCNGLKGLFLGGHDRDLYIQCTSHEYADLPLIDASQGGCIMSCSHFERAAGRELSKKWKESIHVIGEGEGSKATLLAWLKRQADGIAPDIVGSTVWVCWCNEAEYYHGTVLSFNKESGKHKVRYNERLVEELHLPVEKLDFGQAKPEVADAAAGQGWLPVARPVLQQELPNVLPALLTPTSKAAQGYDESSGVGAVEIAGSPSGQPVPLPYHLLHQNSSTSMTSASTDQQAGLRHINTRKRASSFTAASPRATNGLQQPVTPGRGRRSGRSGGALACSESLQESGDGLSGFSHPTHILPDCHDTTMPAVPKKLRTGLREAQSLRHAGSLRHAISMPAAGRSMEQHPASPLAGLASLATATSLAMGSSHFEQYQQQQHSGMTTSTGFAAPLLGSLSSVQQMAILSMPPVAGLQESDVAVMSCWMNKVALQLDDVLVDGVHVLAEPVTVAGMAGGVGLRHMAQHGSPSARFQNLLVHARSRGTVQGYYEAMLTRYDHFRDKPAALLVKMAEFIMAALTDDMNKQYTDAVIEQHRLSEAQT